jgi:hypothetical protein
MKRFIHTLLSILLGVAVMLAAVLLLEFVAHRILLIQSPFFEALSILATLILAVLLLVGSTYISTHLVVRLFRHDAPPPNSPF